MANHQETGAIAVKSDDPAVEVGQLADERQFIAAIQRVDGGWMAVVHFFSGDGDHVATEHSAILDDGGAEPPDAVRGELGRMLRQLEPYQTDAATVAPFEIEVAGRRIGLAPDRETGGARLEPGGPSLAAASEP